MEAFFALSILVTLVTSHGINVVVAQNPSIDAIYQFGDSISDTGNDVSLSGPSACGTSPYGETYFNHPTGRCSNGRLMVDFFAQALGLPLLSPILDKSGTFSHGANFAVAGATAITTSKTSLPNQLAWFRSLLPKICPNQGACKQKLANALFLVGEIGGNDYNGPAFGGGKNPNDLKSLTPKVVATIMDVAKQLIGLGATKLVVPGNFPVGCMTIYLAAYKTSDPNMYDELGCLKNWNDLAAFHNTQLQGAIKSLQAQNPQVKIVYGDYFNALRSVFQNAAALGFDKDNIHKACCGSGNNEYNFGGGMCGTAGVTACPNPALRVSWDGIHLTEHVYQVMADQLLKQILPALS
ncbi:GDSL esterase/lipase At2g27360-like [Silene latifolia]|uniref:GDSL esterase/lipase At2g27360-like n=1 Tax=Silene latifolia TaxID=37657 RepID=UPI003D776B8D